MSFLSFLEKHLGRFAIPGLIRYVAMLNALSVVLVAINPAYREMLILDPMAVRDGQWWRLLSFIFLPESRSPLFALLQVLLMWFLGEGLERAWGAFRLNVFYLSGMIAVILAACFFGSLGANFFLNASLFFAFATIYPEIRILVFFIIPMKVKWVAWITLGILLLGLLSSPISAWAAAIVSLSNYLMFFVPVILRRSMERQKVIIRRAKFENASKPAEESLYRCAVCGRTELSHPDLEFRVGSDGKDYCQEHRKTAQTA